MIETIDFILESVNVIASILGFLALYGIAIALLDWKKFKKIENEWKHLNDD